MFKDIAKLEERLKLPSGFYRALYNEDDWSFIIKVSALFEAASTHILSVRLRAPELESAFSYLEQANDKYGKLQLLRKLKALNEDQFKFLTGLASLRNKLAHNIENVGFKFSNHIEALDKGQRKSFVSKFGYSLHETVEFEGKSMPKQEYLFQNTKYVLWRISADILACLYLEIEIVEINDNMKSLEWSKQNLTTRPEVDR
jgi:hypothetical protein